jgi:hypothetical protein
MRQVLTAVALAFLMSWAHAEWPRTTRRVVSGTVNHFDGGVLTVGAFMIPLRDTTIVEHTNTPTELTPHEITQGQPVVVTLRCVPNHIPGCVAEKVRFLGEVPLR